jgi:conjugative relaxase-like TrwC/TraI family protein
MLRVTTLHASSAANTAAYYTQYLTAAPGEVPGVWCGRQATALGVSGVVEEEPLELLLSGRDPVSATPLGRELVDRVTRDGRVVKAVSGFDATFSAPKSVSVWWGLTGDVRFLEAHDVAVNAVLDHLERFGSTTRIRRDGRRLHPDTGGLTMATFRQTTSRADDPQIHTHAVISAKVQTDDERWWALDARYLKRHQRMLGGLYQSVLRNELTHRFGVAWAPIVNGQAEIAGMPQELLSVFSKRAAAIDVALAAQVDAFRDRHGCEPSRSQRAAMAREAAEDTRGRKSGHGATDLMTRWAGEAAAVGWTVERLVEQVQQAAAERSPTDSLTVTDVVEAVSSEHSSWGRPDVIEAICDLHRPLLQISGTRWAAAVERGADKVLERCIDLDPSDATQRRDSDGRSVWIEPTAPRFTSQAVLVQEERILSWALDAQADPASTSRTVERSDLDVFQADAAASVAGADRLVLVVGPAGAGKTRMLAAAVADLHAHDRAVFAVAPTATAARVLERDTGMGADTVAKLLHEWQRPDRPPRPEYQLRTGTTLFVDEAGMLSTPALHQLVTLAEANRWRLVLVGDDRQLQAVGRGGLFAELCANGRVDQLEHLHRFTHDWEAAASLQLRSGDPRALDAYEAHHRIIPGTLADHLAAIANTWIDHHRSGDTVALVASRNNHVDAINRAVQTARVAAGHLDPNTAVQIAGGECAHVGDVVATRRNDRTLTTSAGEQVRNRETWTVTAVGTDGSLTVTRERGHGTVTLPADYVHEHVRLGYAATEHGYQSETVDDAIALVSTVTTRRGLYVAATRGREQNVLCVVTDGDDVTEARDLLEVILAYDRADVPAVTQRRHLANQVHGHEPAPAQRAAIPEWFEAMLDQARAELATARARHAEHAAELQRVRQAVVAAEQRLGDVDAATAAARDARDAAMCRVKRARGDLAEAQQRLATAARLHRRPARREVMTAQRRAADAEDYLERTRQRTSPSIARSDHAIAERDQLREELRHRSTDAVIGADRVRGVQRRVDVLQTWRCWANGQPVSVERLSEITETLGAERGTTQGLSWALEQTIKHWADHHDIDLRPRQRIEHNRDRVGPDISL